MGEFQTKYKNSELTPLQKRIKKIYGTPLNKLSANDLRFIISQGIGLQYTIPEAFKYLEKNLFLEASYDPGDLLNATLRVKPHFWKQNKELKKQLDKLIDRNLGKDSLDKLMIKFESNFGLVKDEYMKDTLKMTKLFRDDFQKFIERVNGSDTMGPAVSEKI